VIFAGQVLASFARGGGFPILTGGHPADSLRFGAMQISPDVVREEPFRLLSSIFVHFGALHFGLNMMGLANFARIAEPAVGSARFILAYVASGLAGSAATIAFSFVSGPRGITAGASGAIFGVMGLLLGWLIRRKNPAWKDFAVQAVLFSVLFGFGVNASGAGVMINNAAHIGGLLCGIVFGLFYGAPNPPRTSVFTNVAAGVCLLACLASLILSQLSPRWRKLDRSLTSGSPPPGSPDIVAVLSERPIAPPRPTV
jgi:membrane associated rhomboid family serine protease